MHRARLVPLVSAIVLWLVFVAAGALTDLLGRGNSALFAALAWHAFIGFAIARAFPPRDASPESAPFEVTRNALLATIASLASGFIVVYALTGGA